MMIKRLDASSIMNLCVNQVIIDLATCVKELVENSLDAGATKIEIYLKEFGKEGVEVIDNGSGINLDNLETIAQKGATSKLRQFQDLDKLETFGFRGEALNAISILSQLTITTRTERDQIGYRYTFNQDNSIKSKQSIARERGTTICLQDLFGRIPVRREEFSKNIVCQFNKLVGMMTEYGLVSTHCQIIVINSTNRKGREMILNSGPPLKTMLEKSSQILTKKISDLFVPLSFQFGKESRVIEGYVLKKIESGSGNETSALKKNMAFIFANYRPINPLKKLHSIFTDIYRKYNASAKYIYILHLQVQKDMIDFNVSPDKRDVFLQEETELYSALRDNLTELFERLAAVTKVLPLHNPNKRNDVLSTEKNNFVDQSSRLLAQQSKLPFQQLQSKADTPSNKYEEYEEEDEQYSKRIKSDNNSKKKNNLNTNNDKQSICSDNSYFSVRNQNHSSDYINIAEERRQAYEHSNHEKQFNYKKSNDNFPQFDNNLQSFQMKDKSDQKSTYSVKQFSLASEQTKAKQENQSQQKSSYEEEEEEEEEEESLSEGEKSTKRLLKESVIKSKEDNILNDKSNVDSKKRYQVKSFEVLPLREMKEIYHLEEKNDNKDEITQQMSENTNNKKDLKELEELCDCVDEKELFQLNESFRKDNFKDLQIIGQFNKAFIVAFWSEKKEIFLIDQHASDEKTNYERLLKDNLFSSQRLVRPIELSLTPQEADMLESNRDIFSKNGFSFQILREKTSPDYMKIDNYDEMNSIKLLIESLPASKHIQFDINDFDEIFQNLNSEERDIHALRPKKIQRILASKACRSSIMIGSALTAQQMKKILINLSQLQSPWNCPHGRPTMVKTPSFIQLASSIHINRKFNL